MTTPKTYGKVLEASSGTTYQKVTPEEAVSIKACLLEAGYEANPTDIWVLTKGSNYASYCKPLGEFAITVVDTIDHSSSCHGF